MQERRGKKIIRKLRNKYRFVVLNDDTYEEKVSWSLSALNVFTVVGSIAIILVILGIVAITFTPLREYIPGYAGYSSSEFDYLSLKKRTDSLEFVVTANAKYVENIRKIAGGGIFEKPHRGQVDTSKKYKNLHIEPSKEDLALRSAVEAQERKSLTSRGGRLSGFFFFTPVKGIITNSFNAAEEHFGVDVVARENETIKCALEGTVIMAEWTTESGYVMHIQHSNSLVSVYKHNSALLKKEGQTVKSGEAIAIIGNTGELSKGPHLHFELWHNGSPVNPQDYILFE